MATFHYSSSPLRGEDRDGGARFHPPLGPLPSREGKIEEWTIVILPAGSSLGPRIWPFLVVQAKTLVLDLRDEE